MNSLRAPREATAPAPGPRRALLLGGAGSLLISLLHFGVLIAGPRAWAYFGAPSLARLAEQGSSYPAVLTAGIALVFLLWAAYAFSAAGVLAVRLPFPRFSLYAIGGIYALRGLVLIPDVVRLIRGEGYPFRQPVFSAISLGLGILYLLSAAAIRPPQDRFPR